jgi:large subunit ribosomal protein L32e
MNTKEQKRKENESNKKEKTEPEKEESKEKKEEAKEKKNEKEKQKKPKAVNKIKKTKEQKKLQEKIKQKKVPVIRGKFGKAWLRRKSIKKWQKWRKPRGIDFILKKENGAKPKTGFRTQKEIRGLHPSGMKEVYVRNINELKKIKENVVIRVNAKIGKKKKKEILKKAKEMNLRILN